MTRLLALFAFICAAPVAAAPRVATDIAPVHSLAARVMQGVGAPDLILPAGASPHSYAMRASEAAALEGAEIVFWVGPELTPWLERPLENLAGRARVVALLEHEETHRLAYREGGAEDEGHGDEHGHAGEHGHSGETDPHAWLDPENGRAWLDVIADALAEADPENASFYAANAASGAAEIEAVAETVRAAVEGSGPYAVYHDAYHYFEDRFGLAPAFAVATTHAVPPGPARLSELQAAARAQGVRCVFAEPQESDALIRTVFDGMDVEIRRIDPLGAGLETGANLYSELLTSLANAVAGCR